jgi:hypothetical protein
MAARLECESRICGQGDLIEHRTRPLGIPFSEAWVDRMRRGQPGRVKGMSE